MRAYPLSRHPRRLIWPTRARHKGESAFPDLWPDYAWVPSLGATGSVLKSVVGGIDGDLTESTVKPTWVLKGLKFTEAAEYVYIPDNSAFELSKYTYILGILPAAATKTTEINQIVVNGDTGQQFGFAYNHTNVDFVLSTAHKSGSTWYKSKLTSTPPLDELSIIACRYDGTNISIYFNGVKEDEDVAGTPNTESGILSLGGRAGFNSFNGIVEFFYIYNYALSPPQISQLNRDHYCWLRPKDRYLFGVAAASAYPWWYYDVLGRY